MEEPSPSASALIGLIGGLSWQSTALYYRRLNEAVEVRLGRHHNARSMLETLDFDPLLRLARSGRWDLVAEEIAAAGRRIEAAGAELIAITSVTGHVGADAVARAVRVPVIHVADAVAASAAALGQRSLGLLGTRATLTQPFFVAQLRAHGVQVIVPDEAGTERLDRIIIDELTAGRFEDAARRSIVEMIQGLRARGADAAVLACTELPLLLVEPPPELGPLIDAVDAHVDAIVTAALAAAPTLEPIVA